MDSAIAYNRSQIILKKVLKKACKIIRDWVLLLSRIDKTTTYMEG